MSATAPLIGVMIGGSLVLLGDLVRRREERKRDLVARLIQSGTDLLVLLHGVVGDLMEAKESSAPLPNPHAGRKERLGQYTRF